MFWQAIVNGLIMGSLYALVAAGLTLVFGVLNIINIAHGEFLMISMYGTFFLNVKLGIDPYLSSLILVPLLFFVGRGTFRLLIRPVIGSPPINKLLITMGLSLILANLALFLISADYQGLSIPYFRKKLAIYGLIITLPEIIVFCGSISITLFMFWLLRNTKTGRFIRAVAQDREAAALMGIDVPRVYSLSFGLSASCLGIAGPLLMPIYYVYPEIGLMFLLIAFVVIVLGGMGNFIGALVGGFIVGMGESLGALFMPGSSAPLVTFIVFVLLLLIRPQGLFGKGRVQGK